MPSAARAAASSQRSARRSMTAVMPSAASALYCARGTEPPTHSHSFTRETFMPRPGSFVVHSTTRATERSTCLRTQPRTPGTWCTSRSSEALTAHLRSWRTRGSPQPSSLVTSITPCTSGCPGRDSTARMMYVTGEPTTGFTRLPSTPRSCTGALRSSSELERTVTVLPAPLTVASHEAAVLEDPSSSRRSSKRSSACGSFPALHR